MKKLITGILIIGVAVLAHAGSVNWGSGAMLAPNADGSLSTDKVKTANTSSLTMYAWESFAQSEVAYSAGDLYKWYKAGATGDDPFGGSLTAISKAATIGTSATTVSAVGIISDTEGVKTAYGAVLFIMEDINGKVWYMENYGSAATKAGSTKASALNLALKIGGTGAATAWVAAPSVPEPTSAMLMLLGVAGLALKRKRA